MKTIILLIMCVAVSCGSSADSARHPQQPGVPASEKSKTDQTSSKKNPVAVGPVDLYGLWKGSYVKLSRWKDTGDSKVPHPSYFDVLCTIENKSDSAIQHGDLFALTTVEFILAPTDAYSGDVNKVIEANTWGRIVPMDDLRLEPVPYLLPGDHAELKLKNFDLGKVIKEFDGKDDTLWPWALRVNVQILNRDMTSVALGRAILPLFPENNRITGKYPEQ